MATRRKWSGGCLCGDVSYEAKGRPVDVTHCYCSMCRRNSGAGSQTFARFRSERVRWVGRPRVFRSSSAARRGFCGRCGSSLFLDYDDQAGFVWITAGTLDDVEALSPTLHWCTDDRIWWVPVDEELPSVR
ncbi:MAG: GFA family protein [Myxococcota bacterium]